VSDASLAVRPRRDEARARALVDAFAREACALAVRLVDAFDRARVRPSARASKSRAQPNTPGSRGFPGFRRRRGHLAMRRVTASRAHNAQSLVARGENRRRDKRISRSVAARATDRCGGRDGERASAYI
jgi:hypothetical protein